MAEYPRPHVPGKSIPYYPIPRDENQLLYNKYAAAAQAEFTQVHFAGRLADYQYYNMDLKLARARSSLPRSMAVLIGSEASGEGASLR